MIFAKADRNLFTPCDKERSLAPNVEQISVPRREFPIVVMAVFLCFSQIPTSLAIMSNSGSYYNYSYDIGGGGGKGRFHRARKKLTLSVAGLNPKKRSVLSISAY